MEDRQTRTMTWMAGILVALVAAVVLIDPGKEGDDEAAEGTTPTTDPFPDLVSADITELTLTPASSPPLRLARQADGGWNLTAPISARADPEAVAAVLSALESLECSEDIKAEDLAQFGLQPPALAVSATTGAGTTYALRLGTDTPVGWTSYVQCGEGDDAVRTAKQKLSDSLSGDLDDYRDRAALDIPPFEALSALRITTPADEPTEEGATEEGGAGDVVLLSLQAAEGSGRWTLGDAMRPADPGRARDITRKIRDITIETFSAAPLMPPITTLKLTTASGQTATILVGANGAAKVPTQEAPVTLDEEVLLAILSASSADLLSRELLSTVDVGAASSIQVALADRHIEATREANGWSNPAAEDLIATLQIVRVERSLSGSDEETPEGPPWGTIRAQTSGDQVEEVDIYPLVPERNAHPAHSRTTGEDFWIPATEVERMQEVLPAS